MSGTAIAQVLTVSAAPILSRLYEPEAFGTFAMYTSIVSVLMVLVTLRYELAIVLPDREEEAKNVFLLSNIIVVLMSLLTLAIVSVFGNNIANFFDSPQLTLWLWWVPISIFSMGVYQNLVYWNTRRKQFRRVAISQISRSSMVVGTQLLGGGLGGGPNSLIGGQVIGQVVAASVLGSQVLKGDKAILIKPMVPSDLKKAAMKYIDFPRYSAPQGLLNAISQNLPTFLLSYYYVPTVLGYYALSLKLLQMPISLITQSVRQVFYQKVSHAYRNNQNYFSLLNKTTIALFSIGILPALLIVIYGPDLFSLVLGNEWYKAGKFARWMILWLFFGFINSPSFVTAQTLGLQKQLMYYELGLVVFRAGALVIGGIYLDALNSIILYSLVGAFFNFGLILAVYIFVWVKSKDIQAY